MPARGEMTEAEIKGLIFDMRESAKENSVFSHLRQELLLRAASLIEQQLEGWEITDEMVIRGAGGILRLFIERDDEKPMPNYRDLARAALTAAFKVASPSQQLDTRNAALEEAAKVADSSAAIAAENNGQYAVGRMSAALYIASAIRALKSELTNV